METIFRKVPVSESPMNKQIVFAIDKGHKQVLCVFEGGNFYRHTDDSGNDRLIRFYYPDVTHWLEEVELPSNEDIISGRQNHLTASGLAENKQVASQIVSHDWSAGVSWLMNWILTK